MRTRPWRLMPRHCKRIGAYCCTAIVFRISLSKPSVSAALARYCAIALLVSDGGAPLLLQIKEAQESVLARFAGSSTYANHGERVVVGQRMLQAATDIFLGWPQIPLDGRYFYV